MREKQEIKIAKTAGFCWGVKRAIDITLETAKETDGPVSTYGPLIHNPQVIETLEGKEVYAADTVDSITSDKVIIRTHGIAPEVRRDLKSHGLSITDATCPLVARVQGLIKKYANKGYTTVIIGDKGHAEVIGLMGFTGGRCHVVKSEEEVETLPPMDNVCVVAQTTCDTRKHDKIVSAIIAKYPEAIVNDTICDATGDRQGEVLALASEVDAIVVVGGKNSSNTKRLASMAEECGARTFHIETEDELDPDEIIKYEKLGLTAGASTPTWMIERVKNRLEKIRDTHKPSLWKKILRLVEAAVISNVGMALGAVCMVFSNSILAGIPFSWEAAYISAAYLFSMHVLNRLNDVQTFKHNEPETIRLYLRYKTFMAVSASVAILSAIAISVTVNLYVTAVLVWALVVGLAYTVKWFQKNEIKRIHRLKDIPASKDVFVGVAWAVVTALVPALATGFDLLSPSLAVAFLFTFTIVYIRSVLSDVRDIRGDKIVGRETIPIIVGIPGTKVFLAGLTFGLGALMVVAVSAGWVGPFGYVLLLSIAYTGFYLFLYDRHVIKTGLAYDLVVDGVFIFSGLLAIIWTLY
ncbi:4-hydroxy-3-methylbut-2-enyl diphosphate reductase [hydrothermal vent metagenome]|uniref:4-hydroxy-3-methylbut-2-enyl diphosphate reductase n=1 Tax=hydrothermal vent metagenome TaxID=652676 RepID=A0A3B1BGE2_9ZZZZ